MRVDGRRAAAVSRALSRAAAPPAAAEPPAPIAAGPRPARVASRVTAGRRRRAARRAAARDTRDRWRWPRRWTCVACATERRQRPLGVRLQWAGAVRVRAAGHRAAPGRAAAIPGGLRDPHRPRCARATYCSSTPNRTARRTSPSRSTARPSSMRRTHGAWSAWSGCRRPTGRGGFWAHAASNRAVNRSGLLRDLRDWRTRRLIGSAPHRSVAPGHRSLARRGPVEAELSGLGKAAAGAQGAPRSPSAPG